MSGRTIGYLLPSIFICSNLFADTLQLKDGATLKGLVVEEHEDRVILSTENGEVPVLRSTISELEYDDPAQNFLKAGRAYEDKKRYGEALAYYEKALALNPNLEDAKKATVRVRNLFWAQSATGPVAEIERRQSLYETWDKGRFTDKNSPAKKSEPNPLADGAGIKLAQKDDWIKISEVQMKKDAARAGLKVGDRLVAIDGDSLRYLSVQTVSEKFISPRYSSFTLEYDRDCKLVKSGYEREAREFGFELKSETRGLVVTSVKNGTAAARAGLKENDLVVGMNGATTRYIPLKKFITALQKDTKAPTVMLTVRRSTMMARH